MATGKTTGNSEFLEFLKGAPTLDEASSQDVTDLTGIVSRTTDGKFAITVPEGQTYELDAGAVQRFRMMDGPGFTKIVTIQILSDALKAATLRPIKPIFKDIIKDPIKEMIHDGKKFPIDTLAGKDLHTDPVADEPWPKRFITDPAVDNVFKDWTRGEPPKPMVADPTTGIGDIVSQPGLIDQVVNPATGLGSQGPMPFAMATPHHAPAHLLAMQMGVQPPGGFGGAQNYKPVHWEKHPWSETTHWADNGKPFVLDTRKEIIRDTIKEMAFDPQNTWAEGIFDPTQIGRGPQPEPWAGGMGFM